MFISGVRCTVGGLFFVLVLLSALGVGTRSALGLEIVACGLEFNRLTAVSRLTRRVGTFRPSFMTLRRISMGARQALTPRRGNESVLSRLTKGAGVFKLCKGAVRFDNNCCNVKVLSGRPCVDMGGLVLPGPRKTRPHTLLRKLFRIKGSSAVFFTTARLSIASRGAHRLRTRCVASCFGASSCPIVVNKSFGTRPGSGIVGGVVTHR